MNAINLYRQANQPIVEKTPAKARDAAVHDYDSDEGGPRNIHELLQMSTKKNVGVLASRTMTSMTVNRPKSRSH